MSFDAKLESIKKHYGEVKANDGVNVNVRSGSIHALIGENGAGKSTAMKILFGMIQPTSGNLYLNNIKIEKWNSQLAFKYGMGMVHQHFMLASNETVHDNLVLGVEQNKILFRNRDLERNELEKLMQHTGLIVPLDKNISEISVGLQSRCEILKVLYRKASFLILDEPTAVLTPQEIEDFLKTLVTLRKQGKTILMVTHKLKEVMMVADDATILRTGKTVATRNIKDTSIEELSELMVGRKLVMPKVSAINFNNKIILETQLQNEKISLEKGMILGIAGVEGNGQELLVTNVLENAKKNNIAFGYIPSDRHHDGIILEMKLFENLRLNYQIQTKQKNIEVFPNGTNQETHKLHEFDVRPNNLNLSASALSGGNQQKLIVARELTNLEEDGVLIAVHPTRGVDLGAIEFIHDQIIKAAKKGVAVLLVSSELEELMSLSHKIGTIYNRKINAWFNGPNYSENQIGFSMLGGAKQ